MKTKEDWLKSFKDVHGDRYDYSKFEYINSKTKSTFVCKEHGDFQQHPRYHAKGQGCPLCANKHRNASRTISLESWIEECRLVHNNLYDYSRSVYGGANKPIEVICPLHGSFYPTPYNHKKGSKCSKCVDRNSIFKQSTEEFIKKARIVHGNKFDYSRVKYINNATPVELICGNGHVIKQRPNGHLSGRGCYVCRSMLSTSKQEILLQKHLESLGVKYIQNWRPSWMLLENSKTPSEIDLYIPSLSVGIEYNGAAYHHSSRGVSKFLDSTYLSEQYHLRKYQKCKDNSVDLIHIFEFENFDVWLEKLKDLINEPENYQITFENTLRQSSYNKHIVLDFYGESLISRVTRE